MGGVNMKFKLFKNYAEFYRFVTNKNNKESFDFFKVEHGGFLIIVSLVRFNYDDTLGLCFSLGNKSIYSNLNKLSYESNFLDFISIFKCLI